MRTTTDQRRAMMRHPAGWIATGFGSGLSPWAPGTVGSIVALLPWFVLHLLPWPIAPLSTALGRGILGRCPACGQAHLFAGFLRIVRDCASWRAPLGAARAHDAPPYFVILITGHIVIPAMLLAKKFDNATNSQLTAIFVPLTLVLAVGLPRPVKGGVLAALLSMELLDGTAGLE